MEMQDQISGVQGPGRLRGSHRPVVQGRGQVRPEQRARGLHAVQHPTRRPRTRPTAGAQARLLVVSLLDAAFWMLPALLLNAAIIYVAWCEMWI